MAVSGCGPARTPFVDLAPFLPLDGLAEVHDEICLALARLPSGFTGGSHRSLGILPKNREDDVFGDYGEVFATLDDQDLATLAKLGDSPRWRAPSTSSAPGPSAKSAICRSPGPSSGGSSFATASISPGRPSMS